MVGSNLLHLVDRQLQRIKANTLPFGGVSIVLCGDCLQLPPVGDFPLYQHFSHQQDMKDSYDSDDDDVQETQRDMPMVDSTYDHQQADPSESHSKSLRQTIYQKKAQERELKKQKKTQERVDEYHLLYQLFNTVIVLKHNMRQTEQDSDNERYRRLLTNIRVGNNDDGVLETDWNWCVKQRSLSTLKQEMTDTEYDNFVTNSVHFFARNETRSIFNLIQLRNMCLQTKQAPIRIRAKHYSGNEHVSESVLAQADTAPCDESSHENQLSNEIYTTHNSRVMLDLNLNTSLGLTHGFLAIVEKICYDKALPDFTADPKHVQKHAPLPAYVMVRPCPNSKCSVPAEYLIDGCIPIKAVRVSVSVPYVDSLLEREMIPLSPASGISIHKGQGSTVDNAIFHFGETEYAPGLMYTGLSRCRKFNGMAIDNMSPEILPRTITDPKTGKTRIIHGHKYGWERVQKIVHSASTAHRRAEDARLTALSIMHQQNDRQVYRTINNLDKFLLDIVNT